jgi:hypothetical protein
VQKRITLAVLAITELADLCWFLLQLVQASAFFPAVVIQQFPNPAASSSMHRVTFPCTVPPALTL